MGKASRGQWENAKIREKEHLELARAWRRGPPLPQGRGCIFWAGPLSLGRLLQSWGSKHHPYIGDAHFCLSPDLTGGHELPAASPGTSKKCLLCVIVETKTPHFLLQSCSSPGLQKAWAPPHLFFPLPCPPTHRCLRALLPQLPRLPPSLSGLFVPPTHQGLPPWGLRTCCVASSFHPEPIQCSLQASRAKTPLWDSCLVTLLYFLNSTYDHLTLFCPFLGGLRERSWVCLAPCRPPAPGTPCLARQQQEGGLWESGAPLPQTPCVTHLPGSRAGSVLPSV